jgi:protein-tyrosine phosphatase
VSEWFDAYGFEEVGAGLLVGSYPQDADDVAALAAAGVTRVFNLVSDVEYGGGARAEVEAALAGALITERRLPLVDFGGLLPGQLERAVNEVLRWLAEGEHVYVHCRAGLQRSIAVAAGVLALRDGTDLDDALAAIAARRPGAVPLPHQRRDLARWWRMRSI